LIFSLQALGADLVSKDFIRRELPWSVNVTMEEQRIEIEKMRDNLSAAITATAQSIPAMAAQGQDPSPLIQKIADVIDRRRKGDTIEAAALAVFEPQQMQPEMTLPGQQAPVEQATPSPAVPGQPAGGVPPMGGTPDLATILAGLGG
jgi:cell division septation protein DedD